MPAHLTQYPQRQAFQRMTAARDHHRRHRPCTPPKPTAASPRPFARNTAAAIKPMLASSNPVTAAPKSTPTPSARLAAIRNTCASLSEHGNRPASSALVAARHRTQASTLPPARSPAVSTNRSTKSLRRNHTA